MMHGLIQPKVPFLGFSSIQLYFRTKFYIHITEHLLSDISACSTNKIYPLVNESKQPRERSTLNPTYPVK